METTPVKERTIIAAVDDDDDDIDLLRLLFQKASVLNPFQVYRHGEDLMGMLASMLQDTLQAVTPLVCFLDVKMPGTTGHDVLEWIRGQAKLNFLPVVMLSGSDNPEDIKRARELGAQCYLAKFPTPTVLKTVVAAAEKFARGLKEGDCFRLPENLLLSAA